MEHSAQEFATKHANLALMRTGYVAGEIAVIAATPHSKAQISWNLMSVSVIPFPSFSYQSLPFLLFCVGNLLYPHLRRSGSR